MGWIIYNSKGEPLVTQEQHDHTAADASGPMTNDEHDGYSQYDEIADPGAGAANKLRVYAFDVGGVTGLQLTDSAAADTWIGARTRYMWLQPDDFIAGLGVPTLVTVGAWSTGTRGWLFRAGIADGIMGGKMLLPADWGSGTVVATAYYQGAGGNTGNRVLGIAMSALTPGADSILKAIDASESKPVVHGNNVLNIATFAVGVLTVAAGDILRVTFWRDGASGADPNIDGMYFFGIRLAYTAFF